MKCSNENVSLSGSVVEHSRNTTRQSLNCLHSFSPKRWLCCAACTIALVLLVLALPFWNFHVKAEVSEAISENAVSVVRVTQKRKAKPVEKAVDKKMQPKTENAIPAPVNEPAAEREENQNQEEADENQETDDTSEENFSDSTEDFVQTENAGEFSENPVMTEEMQKAQASYKSYALSRIAGKKQYPYSARSKGLEGKVRVRVVIKPDGTLSECEILTPCEHEALNEACLSAIRKSAPFKKMKSGMEAMTLVFVMDFSLK